MRKGFIKMCILLLACLMLFTSVSTAEELSLKKDSLAVGNIVTFGRYEQDASQLNGPEPIEWIVLEVREGKALLLSKYGLDAMPFHSTERAVTWETCSLRSWMNGDFLYTAFNAQEQSMILLTDVDNSEAQGYSGWNTFIGNNTRDKVFALSAAEAGQYLGVDYDDKDNTISRVAPTAYARQNGADTNEKYQTTEGLAAGWWWLRSPGRTSVKTTYVNCCGALNDPDVDISDISVRPAIWVNMEADLPQTNKDRSLEDELPITTTGTAVFGLPEGVRWKDSQAAVKAALGEGNYVIVKEDEIRTHRTIRDGTEFNLYLSFENDALVSCHFSSGIDYASFRSLAVREFGAPQQENTADLLEMFERGCVWQQNGLFILLTESSGVRLLGVFDDT